MRSNGFIFAKRRSVRYFTFNAVVTADFTTNAPFRHAAIPFFPLFYVFALPIHEKTLRCRYGVTQKGKPVDAFARNGKTFF